jgi:hypothetical protein
MFKNNLHTEWANHEWVFKGEQLNKVDKKRLIKMLKDPEDPDRLYLALDAYFSDLDTKRHVCPDTKFMATKVNMHDFKSYLHQLLGNKYDGEQQ